MNAVFVSRRWYCCLIAPVFFMVQFAGANDLASGIPQQILILGNSIVHVSPDKGGEWKGNWGMAASSEDSDFVHILSRRIYEKAPKDKITADGPWGFERDYRHYQLSRLEKYRFPDILVMKIGENVIGEQAKDSGFSEYYQNLLNYLVRPNRTKVILVSGFWRNDVVNQMILDASKRNGYDYVAIDDLSKDTSNTAEGLFKTPGIAMHPGNKGMHLIADRIWADLEKYVTR